jgi:glycosyltransferase involved in cell wall biosynthesis
MKNNKIPKVTVLMAVYNAEKYTKLAIDSILLQTFKNFEFLIINDASTDSSLDLIESYDDPRIRLITNEENLGLVKTLNRGLKLAEGEYIARMDADDICDLTRLQKQIDFFEQNPDHVLLGSSYILIDQDGKEKYRKIKPLSDIQVRWISLFRTVIDHPVAMFSSSLAKQLTYNENYKTTQDYDLWLRMMQHGKAAVLKEPLLSYRMHSENVSTQKKSLQRNTMKSIAIAHISREFSLEDETLNNVNVFFDTFLLEVKANKESIVKCIQALEFLKHEFIKKQQLNKKNQIWLNRNLAGLLADTLLIRGGVIKNVPLSVFFIWKIKRYWWALIVQSINVFTNNVIKR